MMNKIKYKDSSVTKNDRCIIDNAIPILEEYYNQGYRVTLRQLHYQFVARGYLTNSDQTYKTICKAMLSGRMEGLIGWDTIEDRTRILRSCSRWDDPADILNSCANCYHVDYWINQNYRVELWIEKDALLGIVEDTCNDWDCPYLSCRGYSSISELHEASQRIKQYNEMGQNFKILYCGDMIHQG